MQDSDDDRDAFQPPKKSKGKLGEGSSESMRFAEVTSEEELASMSKGVVPKNTRKNDQWALSTFMAWIKQRNQRSRSEQCSKYILESDDAECLSKWLSLFTIETRKKDGSKYPPASVHLLLCGLQRIMRRNNHQPFDIFAKRDVQLRGLHGTMESVFQSLHSEGVGAEIKHIPLITEEEEEAKLWKEEILGDTSPHHTPHSSSTMYVLLSIYPYSHPCG